MQQDEELTHGGEVAFVGRPVNAEVKEGELNPALQNALDKFTLDVTARAREGNIDPVFGRDNEIRQMVDILSRRRKNNPILVGEPGVGKTALVEGLALRIAEGNVPDALKSVSVRTLDLGLLQAGAGVKGEFEQRLKTSSTRCSSRHCRCCCLSMRRIHYRRLRIRRAARMRQTC